MPDITLNQMLPSNPLHWTSIFHYIILLSTLLILMSSRSDISIIFIITLGALAVMTGADLYAERIPAIGCFAIFMFHAGMVGLPLLLGGLSPGEETRGIAVLTGLVFGLPLLASLILGYFIPLLGDPRYMRVCG